MVTRAEKSRSHCIHSTGYQSYQKATNQPKWKSGPRVLPKVEGVYEELPKSAYGGCGWGAVTSGWECSCGWRWGMGVLLGQSEGWCPRGEGCPPSLPATPCQAPSPNNPSPFREQCHCQSNTVCCFCKFWASCLCAKPCTHSVQDLTLVRTACRTLIGYFVSASFGTVEFGGCIFWWSMTITMFFCSRFSDWGGGFVAEVCQRDPPLGATWSLVWRRTVPWACL